MLMRFGQTLSAILMCCLLGCGVATSEIEVSPPPPEARMPTEVFDSLDSFVEMGEAHTQRHIVSGVEQDQRTGQWWARSGAKLRFLTLPLDEIRFGLNFSLAPEAVARGKSVTVMVKLNGQPFLDQTFDAAGAHSTDQAVPKALVTWQHETQVEIMIESPAGRAIEQPVLQITSMGFRP